MNLTKRAVRLAMPTAVAIILAPSAWAQAQPGPSARPGWYLGAGIGSSKVMFDESRYLTFGTASGPSFEPNSSAPMGKVFAGLRLNRHFALEGGYYVFDKFGARRTFDSPSAGTLSTSMRVQGLGLDLVGHLPVSPGLSLFGKAGIVGTRVDTNGDVTGALFSGFTATDAKRREVNFKYGLGAELALSRQWAVRGEWEVLKNVGNGNVYDWESDLRIVSGSVVGKF